MKKTIHLKETELKRMIAESVKKVLKEGIWYGDVEPFKKIINAASEIMKENEYANAEDYEPWDDGDSSDYSYDIYKWAEKISNEAEEWLGMNSSNTSINGGENW